MLPPPQKNLKKQNSIHDEAKTADHDSLEGLDITLSQLTLSGLNELATKLNIPTNQLSNMTLVQLTAYISSFIKSGDGIKHEPSQQDSDFKEDFADFNNFNNTDLMARPDKYAVFRELLQEEIKQTHIYSEPEENNLDQDSKSEVEEEKPSNLDAAHPIVENGNVTDRYAALREIVETEIKQTLIVEKEEQNDNKVTSADKENNLEEEPEKEDKESESIAAVDDRKELISPPVDVESTQANRPTSGSLSDIISESSPEVGTPEVKKSADTTGNFSHFLKLSGCLILFLLVENWAVFAEGPVKDKQSEEGVSPWSSDSKEFGNGSPPEWTMRRNSGDRWGRVKQEQEEWWDAAEDIVEENTQGTHFKLGTIIDRIQ